MKIQVILPLYITNKATWELAEKLICKLVRQNKRMEYEIVIIDDGSPYKYRCLMPLYGVKYIRRSKNEGAASARNLGLDNANCPFIAFVDADDDIADDFFEQLEKATELDADICYFKCTCEDGSVAYHEPCAWGKLVKRSYIGDRRFDEQQNIGEEDTLFLPLQAEKPPKIEYIDSVLYHYRWSANPDSLMKRYWRGDIKKRK